MGPAFHIKYRLAFILRLLFSSWRQFKQPLLLCRCCIYILLYNLKDLIHIRSLFISLNFCLNKHTFCIHLLYLDLSKTVLHLEISIIGRVVLQNVFNCWSGEGEVAGL